jgi:hypothetical protein
MNRLPLFSRRTLLFFLFALVAMVAAACHEKPALEPTISLEPFRSLARNSRCVDKKNRLFLIDGHIVFWDRASSCADASYSQVLYDSTVDRVVCEKHDSIAGPQRVCDGGAIFSSMFDTILDHLDAPDLGLGKDHKVKPVKL